MAGKLQGRDLHAQARSGLWWIFSTTTIWQIVSWGTTILTARFLTPRDYGLLALSEAVYPYLAMAANLRLDSWLAQRNHITGEEEESIFGVVLLSGLGAAVVAYFSASLVAWFFAEPEVIRPFQVLAVIFLLRSFQVLPEARLKREMRFKELSLINLVIGLARGITQLTLAYLGYSYWALVAGFIFKESLTTLALIWAAGSPKRVRAVSPAIREALNFGFLATGSSLLWILYTTADNIVVGRICGTEVLGYYAMAFYLADLPFAKVNSVLGPMFIPYFSKLSGAELRETFLRMNRIIIAVLAPIFLGTVVVASDAVPLVLGEHWLPLVLPLQVLSITGIWRTFSNNSSTLLFAQNEPKRVFRGVAVTAVVLPLCFVGLGWYFARTFGSESGLWGIYVTWLFVFPIAGVGVMVRHLREVLSLAPGQYLSYVGGPLLTATVACILAALAGRLVHESAIGRLTVEIGTAAVAYPLLLVLLFQPAVREMLRNSTVRG